MDTVPEWSLYCLFDAEGAPRYVGVSKQIDRRWAEHKRKSNNWIKAEVILFHGLTQARAEEFEKVWINALGRVTDPNRSGMLFNKAIGGNLGFSGGMLGRKHSEKTRSKMSVTAKSEKRNLKKMRAAALKKNVGRLLSVEHRAKVGRKGRLISDEQKLAISRFHEGKPKTEEHKRKLSVALKGKSYMSAEGKRRLILSNLGKTHSSDSKIKMANNAKNRPEDYYIRAWEARRAAALIES